MIKFLRYYLWELDNELYACFYFVAMLSMYSIEVLLNGDRSVNILVMLEMLILCYVLALVQRFLFSKEESYNKKELILRSIAWIVFSLLLIIAVSIGFHWFKHLQGWAFGAFMVFMVIFFIAMWIALYIMNLNNTKNLNHMLKNYQKKI